MDVTTDGTLSLLTYTESAGAFVGGKYFVSTPLPRMHMLKYDLDGNFLKGYQMDITEGDAASLLRIRMAFDYKNDVYYLFSPAGGESGIITPKFGSTKMSGTNCLFKYNNSGSAIWVQQSKLGYFNGVIFSEPKLDKEGYIYLGTGDKKGNTFGGFAFTNSLSAEVVPVIFKSTTRRR